MRAPVFVFVDGGAQGVAPPREQRAHGARPAAQGAGDVLVGQVVDVAQGQRGALARRQAVEEREAPGRLAVVYRPRRIVPGTLGLAAPPGAAGLAQRGAHRDAVQPGVERGGVAQRAGPADGGDGDVLGDVGGRLGVAEDAERGAPRDLQRAAGHALVGEGVGAADRERPGMVDGGHCLLGALRRPRMLHPGAATYSPPQMRDPKIGEILVQPDDLKQRVRTLGQEVSAEYADRDLLLVGVLKGAVFFLADLMRHIEIPCEVDFMAVSSYGSATDSSGVVRILKDLDTAIEGRHVLIVEDIVDSGLTLQYLFRNLGARNPASLEVCALLTKPDRRKVELPIKFVGFEIPDRFAIGYGLDFAERYRNLPYVAALTGVEE